MAWGWYVAKLAPARSSRLWLYGAGWSEMPGVQPADGAAEARPPWNTERGDAA